jgi:hypothetical protein
MANGEGHDPGDDVVMVVVLKRDDRILKVKRRNLAETFRELGIESQEQILDSNGVALRDCPYGKSYVLVLRQYSVHPVTARTVATAWDV